MRYSGELTVSMVLAHSFTGQKLYNVFISYHCYIFFFTCAVPHSHAPLKKKPYLWIWMLGSVPPDCQDLKSVKAEYISQPLRQIDGLVV